MATNIDLMTKIDELRTNPTEIQRHILNMVEESTDGKIRLVDPTNPFVFLVEAMSAVSSAVMLDNESQIRKQYPSIASNVDEVYLHMSDVDYLDRFAVPSRTEFLLYIGKEELKAKAVTTPSGTVKQITIPRDSFFTVSGMVFTLQYPIDIKVMSHGGIQVVYDTTEQSPLQTIETNVLKWRAVIVDNVEFLEITIPAMQFAITSAYSKVSATTGFNQTVNFADQYYYARVYMADSNGDWNEIRTTHTDQVYDPNVMTAVLKVYQNALNIKIPSIYVTTEMLENELRIDVYTTKGPMDVILSDFDATTIFATWRDLAGGSSIYSAPLNTFSNITLISNSVTTGGRNALDFKALRQRYINNAVGNPTIPITNNQLTTRVEDRGYNLIKNIDNITNRVYLATRALPPPTDLSTVSGAGTAVVSLQATVEQIADQADVFVNDDRLTILPSTLYQRIDGVLHVVPHTQRASISAMSNEARAAMVSSGDYLYTPFHYVLDSLLDQFNVRAYHLDSPKIEAKAFIHENDTTTLSVSTRNYYVERVPLGYRLVIMTRSSDSFKALQDGQIYPQLSYIPPNESTRAVLLGELIGVDEELNERMYRFDITTNYDVDVLDRLVLTSFKMDTLNIRTLPTDLTTVFDLSWVVTNSVVTNQMGSSNDALIASYLLPFGTTEYVSVVWEQFTIRLGDSLDNLWNRSRTIASAEQYQRYTSTVYKQYDKDIYELDSNGYPKIIVDGNGDISLNILHHEGDFVFSGSNHHGAPDILHEIGDIKHDASGNPLLLEPRKLLRDFDLTLVDGRYYWATGEAVVAYRSEIANTFVDWLNKDIAPLSKLMIEKTDLYFQPQATLGLINVIAEQGRDITIPAEQEFTIVLYVNNQAYDSSDVRTAMEATAVSLVNELLLLTTVDVTSIAATVKSTLGDDVMGVALSGLGGDLQLNTVTLKDSSQRLVIKKRLVVDPTDRLIMENAINVVFAKHLPTA